MTGSRKGALALTLSLLGALLPGGQALANRCVELAGGLYRSEGCPPRSREGDRPGAREPRIPERPFQPFDPSLPLLRPPRTPAKEGPTTLADLKLVPDALGGYKGSRPGFRFRIARDGTISFQDRRSAGLPTFDLTDMVIRMQGGDPYVYDKALVVSLTRPMRERMTDQDRGHRMRQALRRLPEDLRVVWQRKDLDVHTRRALLFLLWDELLDEGDRAEADEQQAASQGRSLILDFVHVHLPAGSVDAYPPEEIERLNAGRRSRTTFAPYETIVAD